jgi:hypothetical protein
MTVVSELDVARGFSRAKSTRSVISASFAVLVSVVLSAAAQHPTIEAWVSGRTLTRGVEWSNPALKLSGTIEAEQGQRLYLVEIRVGATDVAAELAAFRLAVGGGAEYVAVAAGGAANLLVPIDILVVGHEMMQILPVDGIIAVTRKSDTSVVVETTPRATLALLYDIPLNATVSALKLPDGTSRAIK